MKVRITRGVLYDRKPLEVGTEIDLQEGIAAAFISQNQAELVTNPSSKVEEEVTESKSEEKTSAPASAKRGKKAKKK